jgi:uncharacterized cupredoxin-like copper-binding protein
MLKTMAAVAVAALLPIHADAPAASRPKPHVVTVVARDYTFEAPDTVAAGTITFHLMNEGKELHHIWLAKLAPGKTMADVHAALASQGPPPSWITDIGGPNAPAPGASSEGTVTLEPGDYLLLCFIPSPDGTPHVMKGMVKPLTVTPSNEGAAEPTADVTMRLVDYAFDLSTPITAGKHVIRIENAAAQPHEVLVAKLEPGKTAMQLAQWAEHPDGPPPGIPLGGATGLKQGRHMFVTMNFEPGRYALLCFVPDAKDGKAHVLHGMVKEFTVSK